MAQCSAGPRTHEELLEVSQAYMGWPRKEGGSGICYSDALGEVERSLGQRNYTRLARAVGDFLLRWNWRFYGTKSSIDYEAIEEFVGRRASDLRFCRRRTIGSLDVGDSQQTQRVGELYYGCLIATHRVRDDAKSPVSASKALHILAPRFFPLWDNGIALGYGCMWGGLVSYGTYLEFMEKIQECRRSVLRSYVVANGGSMAGAEAALACQASAWHGYRPSLLRLIDEYNMAKFSNCR